MTIVYAFQEAPASFSKSLFLAGPTPRDSVTPSWRIEALKLLEKLGYDGVVFVPEAADGTWKNDYVGQIEWEEKNLNRSDVILFWVPRNMATMPALTTNVEWGVWHDSGKSVLGFPQDAKSVSYLEYYGKKEAVPISLDLEGTLKLVIEAVGDGALRTGGETLVPLILWKVPSFQSWYSRTVKSPGNRLDGIKVKLLCRAGPQKKFVFLWVAHVNIWVAAENRNKSNEVILGRPDISTMVLLHKSGKVVLVREFRSTVNNGGGFVLELPGGSSWKPGKDPRTVMCDECHEETGFTIDPSRIKIVGERQLASTFSVHRSLLGAAEITDEELAELESRIGSLRAEENETGERVYLEVRSLDELLKDGQVDWTTLGMIFSAKKMLDIK